MGSTSSNKQFCFQGIFISRVSEEGPAARAGVRVGDKLLEVRTHCCEEGNASNDLRLAREA